MCIRDRVYIDPSEGPNSPGTAADDATVGTAEWKDVNYIKESDNNRAYAQAAGACFLAKTQILIETGTINIENISIGDTILAYKDGQKVKTKVKELISSESEGYFVLKTNQREVKVTKKHPFLTGHGWKKVEELTLGERLITENGTEILISKIYINKTVPVYNLKVDIPHTYFANGFVVHNKPDITHYLKATNFGFSIPSGATINGIKVEIERLAGGANYVYDEEVKIVKSDGNIGTENKADTVTDWPWEADAYATYGGPEDLWSETWSPSDINDVDFGVVLSAEITEPTTFARVDHIRITVYYTEEADTTPPYFTDNTPQNQTIPRGTALSLSLIHI